MTRQHVLSWQRPGDSAVNWPGAGVVHEHVTLETPTDLKLEDPRDAGKVWPA